MTNAPAQGNTAASSIPQTGDRSGSLFLTVQLLLLGALICFLSYIIVRSKRGGRYDG
jgi:flagellar biogenesis protein FliO